MRVPSTVLTRLRQRELLACPPGLAVSTSRGFYQNMMPSTVVSDVQPPECHVYKFTPCGRYLIAFSNLQQEVLVYQFLGPTSRTNEEALSDQLPKTMSFDRCFRLAYQRTLTSVPSSLCRDCCLIAHEATFLILGCTSGPANSARETDPATGMPGVPVVAMTSIISMRLRTGEVCDRYSLADDFVHLHHNAGIHLCKDLLLILAVCSQELHLLQIQASGAFVVLERLGHHLRPQDEMLLSLQKQVEQDWLAAQRPPDADHAGIALPSVPNSPYLEGGLLGPGYLDPDEQLVPEDAVAQQRASAPFEGLRYQLLAAAFRLHQQPPQSLRDFHYHFPDYERLIMWKVQFLDEDHVLLCLGPPDAPLQRSHEGLVSHSFLLVLCLSQAKVVHLHRTSDPDAAALYSDNQMQLHAGNITCDWDRYVTPVPPSAPDSGSPDQAPGAAAGLPVACQSFQSSPYLDQSMWQYDSRHTSATLRTRPLHDQPLRFVSKANPQTRFRLHSYDVQPPTVNGRLPKSLMTLLYHPVEPFIVSIMQAFGQPAQMSFNCRWT